VLEVNLRALCCMHHNGLRHAKVVILTHGVRMGVCKAAAGKIYLSADVDDIVLERAAVAQRTVRISGGQQLPPCRLHLPDRNEHGCERLLGWMLID